MHTYTPHISIRPSNVSKSWEQKIYFVVFYTFYFFYFYLKSFFTLEVILRNLKKMAISESESFFSELFSFLEILAWLFIFGCL